MGCPGPQCYREPSLSSTIETPSRPFAGYCLLMDQGSVDEWAALYTEDGEFVQEGSDPVTGTEALRAFMAAQPVGVVHHILANHTIEVSDDDAILRRLGDRHLQAYLVARALLMTSRRVEGRWRIRRRFFTPDSK